MSDATSPIDPAGTPAIAARLAELEALVAAQQAALKAERDRLREAYEALTREVELARRRLIASPVALSSNSGGATSSNPRPANSLSAPFASLTAL